MAAILIRYDAAFKSPDDYYEHLEACPDCLAYYRITHAPKRARSQPGTIDLPYELLHEARKVVHAEHPLHPTKRFVWGLNAKWTTINDAL